MFDLLFLGTGASVPSRDRALPCVAARRGPDIFLFDCGEGSQRQLMVSPFSFMKVRAVFVTHLHGDHFYGLPGLLQTMGLMGRKDPLLVCGPEGFSDALQKVIDVCEGTLEYELDSRDLEPGDELEVEGIKVTAFATDHGITSLGYRLTEPPSRGSIIPEKAKALGITGTEFSELEDGGTVRGATIADITGPERPGVSIVYTGDTRPCESIVEAAQGADAIIHEATYSSEDSRLAVDHMHSTAGEAAEDAKKAGCKNLFLVHVSNRYRDKTVVREDAAEVFGEHVYLPSDMDQFRVTRGGIETIR